MMRRCTFDTTDSVVGTLALSSEVSEAIDTALGIKS